MPDDEISRRISDFSVKLAENSRKLDDNSKDTKETKDKVTHLEGKLDRHQVEHEEIKRHMQDTRQVLYFGTDRNPGLVEQALACKMSRDAEKEKDKERDDVAKSVNMGWQGWIMLAMTALLAAATVALAIRAH